MTRKQRYSYAHFNQEMRPVARIEFYDDFNPCMETCFGTDFDKTYIIAFYDKDDKVIHALSSNYCNVTDRVQQYAKMT